MPAAAKAKTTQNSPKATKSKPKSNPYKSGSKKPSKKKDSTKRTAKAAKPRKPSRAKIHRVAKLAKSALKAPLAREVVLKMPTAKMRKVVAAFTECLEVVDPREQRKVIHPLKPTIICIALGWLCGHRNALLLELFIQRKLEWLKRVVPDFHGAPISHDTINRLLRDCRFEDMQGFLLAFSNEIIRGFIDSNPGQLVHVAADGQAISSAIGEGNDEHAKVYHVTLYSKQFRLSIAQSKVRDKENEQKALRDALMTVDCTNLLISGDAMHTQVETTLLILERGGHFFFALKGNQSGLLAAVQTAFSSKRFRGKRAQEETEVVSGRETNRRVHVLPASKLDLSKLKRSAEWEKILANGTVVKVVREWRYINAAGKAKDDSVHEDIAYFITSLPYETKNIAKLCLQYSRDHWGIETCLHWCADTNLRQDDTKVKDQQLAANIVALNRFVDNVYSTVQKFLREKAIADDDCSTLKNISKRAVQQLCCNDIDFSMRCLCLFFEKAECRA